MKIKILHLYPNLMNLYGEYANVEVLKKHLSDLGIDVELDKKDTVSEASAICGYDFIYIGSGTERSQLYALQDIMTKKDEFDAAAANGTVMLFTGSAFELLGNKITYADGESCEALGIGNFTAKQQDKKRITGDCYFSCKLLSSPVVGFINKCSSISGITEALFDVKMGFGNDEAAQTEGFKKHNVFGTYVTGPLLVKNPEFMNYIERLICQQKDKGFEFEPISYPYEQKAYEITEKKLYARMNENI